MKTQRAKDKLMAIKKALRKAELETERALNHIRDLKEELKKKEVTP